MRMEDLFVATATRVFSFFYFYKVFDACNTKLQEQEPQRAYITKCMGLHWAIRAGAIKAGAIRG